MTGSAKLADFLRNPKRNFSLTQEMIEISPPVPLRLRSESLEAQRALRVLVFCPIGRRRSGKRKHSSGQFLRHQRVSDSHRDNSKRPYFKGEGTFPWPSPARHREPLRRGGSPGQGKTHLLCGLRDSNERSEWVVGKSKLHGPPMAWKMQTRYLVPQ